MGNIFVFFFVLFEMGLEGTGKPFELYELLFHKLNFLLSSFLMSVKAYSILIVPNKILVQVNVSLNWNRMVYTV